MASVVRLLEIPAHHLPALRVISIRGRWADDVRSKFESVLRPLAGGALPRLEVLEFTLYYNDDEEFE